MALAKDLVYNYHYHKCRKKALIHDLLALINSLFPYFVKEKEIFTK